MRKFKTRPAPAGAMWTRMRDEIGAAILTRIPDFKGWKLSGGTMLATQWQHRESTDIDLKVEPKTGLLLLNPRYDQTFDEKMVELGCGRPLHRKDQVIIPVGNGGKIDLFEGPTVPRKGHYAAEVQGHVEEVLSNAQILTGKVIGRGFESPTRDVYDLAVAAETDPVALEIAINCIPEGTWQETLVRWREAAPTHARAAKEQLRKVPPEWEHVAEDPASAAIERGKSRRYTRLTIEWKNGQLEITTECADGRERLRRFDTDTTEGIADELVCRPGNMKRNSLAPCCGPNTPCGSQRQGRRARCC